MPNWRKSQWKTSNKKPIKKQELWQKLDSLLPVHQIELQWVKGHDGDHGNKKADYLASQAAASKYSTATLVKSAVVFQCVVLALKGLFYVFSFLKTYEIHPTAQSR